MRSDLREGETPEEAPEGGWGYVIMLSLVIGCVSIYIYIIYFE